MGRKRGTGVDESAAPMRSMRLLRREGGSAASRGGSLAGTPARLETRQQKYSRVGFLIPAVVSEKAKRVLTF